MKNEASLALSFLIALLLLNNAAASNVSVWQGQYYTDTDFHEGTYTFNFTIYDAREGGNICWSNTTTLTTGTFGEWKTEQSSVGTSCTNASIDYFLEIQIDNSTQGERRRLTNWDFLRKDTANTLSAAITFADYLYGANNTLKIGGGDLQHTVNRSGFVRQIFSNQNKNNDAVVVYTLENDAGHQFSMALTSSNYNLTQQFEGENRSNLGAISLNAPNALQFLNRWGYPFIWRVSYNGTLTPQTEPMRLEANGNLTIAGNLTSNQSGFFSFLGSTTNRITKLWIQNLDSTGNVNASNYTLNGTTIDDWNDLGSSIAGDNRYLTNDSATMYFNETKLNATIEALDNNTIYTHLSNFTNDMNFINSTQAQIYNDTARINGVNTTSNIDALGFLNKSGTNANQNLNINQYNLTSTGTGFFSFLGSSANRITQILTQDIGVSNNINVSRNVSASQYIANNKVGLTSSSLSFCETVVLGACTSWCTVEITGGIITGCS